MVGGLNMFQADYDNDGCIDVFVPRGAWLHDHGQIPPSLLQNNCNGTFTDVTCESRRARTNYPSQTATWADFEQRRLSRPLRRQRDRPRPGELAGRDEELPALPEQRRRDVHRRRRANRASGSTAWSRPRCCGDYDNDGRPDLYVSVMGGANHLFRNLGTGKRSARSSPT